jgi:hypothetical protein
MLGPKWYRNQSLHCMFVPVFSTWRWGLQSQSKGHFRRALARFSSQWQQRNPNAVPGRTPQSHTRGDGRTGTKPRPKTQNKMHRIDQPKQGRGGGEHRITYCAIREATGPKFCPLPPPTTERSPGPCVCGGGGFWGFFWGGGGGSWASGLGGFANCQGTKHQKQETGALPPVPPVHSRQQQRSSSRTAVHHTSTSQQPGPG